MSGINGEIFRTTVAGPNGPYYYEVALNGTPNRVSPSFASFALAHSAMMTDITAVVTGTGETVQKVVVSVTTGS